MFLHTLIIILSVMCCYTGQRLRFKFADDVAKFTFVKLLWLHFENRTKNNILSPLSICVSYTCLMTGAEHETWRSLARGLHLPLQEPQESYDQLDQQEVMEEFAAVAMIFQLFFSTIVIFPSS